MGKPKSRRQQVKAISTLADLTQDPDNVRAHNPRNVGLIETALNEVGPARSIVVDEQGLVLAGNATVEAAARAGITKVIPVDAEGDALIAVRRRGLTPEQKARLAILDNAPQMPQANPNYWDDEAAAQAVARDEEIFKGILYSGELAQLLGEDPVPDFQPVSVEEQGRLDQKASIICPHCGHEFIPEG